MIVRDQSNNYFHLTPKIGPLWGGGGVMMIGELIKTDKIGTWRKGDLLHSIWCYMHEHY